jgi:SpoVK/Ycf46/Vps4 family AAA+-type ATPase
LKVKTSTTIVEKAKAGYSGLYILSQEPTRTLADLLQASVEITPRRRVLVWTMAKGLWEEFPEENKLPKRMNEVDGSPQSDEMPNSVLELLPKLLKPPSQEELMAMTPSRRRSRLQETGETRAFIVLQHFHHYLDDPQVQSRLVELVQEYKNEQKILILLSPVLKLPPEIEKEFALIETGLPDKEDLAPILDAVIGGVRGETSEVTEEKKSKLLDSALGLTTQEAENAFALSYVRPKQEGRPQEVWDPSVVMNEKCSTLRKSGLLEFYPPDAQGMKAIGGMVGLKQWVARRKRAFTKEAREFGLPYPKGILMVGVPGSGKSLAAKAIAAELTVPLLRCDMGRIYAGLVGASEANVRAVIRIAEAVAPCVLWFDEIEKGIAGSMNGLDSGVGARVLGTILTWMQEKLAPVFVYATANKVSALPPELLRKGRFDELFGVDLPTETERKEIWEVQLANYKRSGLILQPNEVNPNKIDLDHLVGASKGYSGSEIKSVIEEALFMAFSKGVELNFTDLRDSLDMMVPLGVTMAEEVNAIRDWLKKRARPANEAEPKPPTEAPGFTGGRVLEA